MSQFTPLECLEHVLRTTDFDAFATNRFARHLEGGADDAVEAARTGITKVFFRLQHLGPSVDASLTEPDGIRKLIYTAVANAARDELRRQNRRSKRSVMLAIEMEVGGASADPHLEAERAETAEELNIAISHISAQNNRMALNVQHLLDHVLDERTLEDVGRAAGVSRTTAFNRVHAAADALRDSIPDLIERRRQERKRAWRKAA